MAGATGRAVVAAGRRVGSLLRSRLVISIAVAITVILTIVLVSIGTLGDPGQVTAYATVILAIGTVGLAVGAIGTYLEQRDTNRQQAKQLTAAEVANMAQVMITRRTGMGEFLEVVVHNGASRAIREIYVWADTRGITGRLHLGVLNQEGRVDDQAAGIGRGMRNVPHGPDLYWQYRAILPGRDVIFEQLRFMSNNQPAPVSIADTDITTYAEFIDIHGNWWRVDEDGNVNQIEPEPTPPPPPNPIDPATMFGLVGKPAE
jgi:hypothetical protein